MKQLLLVISILHILIIAIQAQDGTLDLTFGTKGIVTMDIDNSNDVMKSIITQPDGKIIVAGYTSNSIIDNFCLVRFNTDGDLDKNFGIGGVVITQFSNTSLASDLCLQNDGKIVVAGHTWSGSVNEFALTRFYSNGTLDITFGIAGIVTTSFEAKNAVARRVKFQKNGKIIVAGHNYTLSNDYDEFALARYDSNGSLDTTFGISGLVSTSFGPGTRNWINSIQLQEDQKIIAGGFSNNSMALARYNINGDLDTLFGNQGLIITDIPGTNSGLIEDIVIHKDGSFFAAGLTIDTSAQFTIVKYNSSGYPDSSFSNNGVLIIKIKNGPGGIKDIELQNDDKILVAGTIYDNLSSAFTLLRLNRFGDRDSTFGTNGTVTTSISTDVNQLESMDLQPDGKILVAGRINSKEHDIALARYTHSLVSSNDNKSLIEHITIFPNPVKEQAILSFKYNYKDEAVSINILNNTGEFLTSINTTSLNNNGYFHEAIPFDTYPNGVYFVRINTPSSIRTLKVVKR